jgi:hypothetical protein
MAVGGLPVAGGPRQLSLCKVRISVTPDPQPERPGCLFLRHLAQILSVVGGPTSR